MPKPDTTETFVKNLMINMDINIKMNTIEIILSKKCEYNNYN